MTWENVAASLVSENKVLCHPSSVDSAETCADKEDHVSMGGFAARKAITIAENVTKIIAIELMTACHALQHRYAEAQEKGTEFDIMHPGLKQVYEDIKLISPMLTKKDRYTVPEYNKIHEYLNGGQMWNTVMQHHESFVGAKIERKYSASQKY
jgi:histidine ammonia-lyase